MNPVDVKPHADAMASIKRALAPFRPEEQTVIVSGILADVLCAVGPDRNKHAAIMMVGTAMDMVFDMIHRTYPENLQ